MYKFFVSDNQIQEEVVKIVGEDVKHIANVLRLKPLEEIIVGNKDTGKSYISQIIEIEREYVICHKKEEVSDSTESIVAIDLFQGLPKMDKMEYIIQKATEIGVKTIYPVALERCIVKLDSKSEKKKIERWQKIAEVAAKQSKRDYIPCIKNVINVKNICQNMKKYDMIVIAYENEETITLKEVLKQLDRKKDLKIGIVIGPEGGLSRSEVEQLIDAGAKSVTLGKRILRTETASLVILSDIIYEFEL